MKIWLSYVNYVIFKKNEYLATKKSLMPRLRNQWKKAIERCQDAKKGREGGGKEEQRKRGSKGIREAQKKDRGKQGCEG